MFYIDVRNIRKDICDYSNRYFKCLLILVDVKSVNAIDTQNENKSLQFLESVLGQN